MTEVLTREKKAAWTAWWSAYKSGTGRKILRQAGRILLGAAPGFALAFSDICGVSAGAWAAAWAPWVIRESRHDASSATMRNALR